MKRWLICAAIVVAAALLSGKGTPGTDVGKIQPVQVVCVSGGADWVKIETDTGDMGTGSNLEQAFENMKAASSAEVYLDTAEYLLISQGCDGLISEMMAHLRPSCTVCVVDGEPDMEKVGEFLHQHEPQTTLMHYRAGKRELPTLEIREGRMELVS